MSDKFNLNTKAKNDTEGVDERLAAWWTGFGEYLRTSSPIKIVGMLVTAAFTFTSVWYVFDPHTNWEWTVASLASIAMITLAEGAFLAWQFSLIQAENKLQGFIGSVMLITSVIAIALTDLASATFAASESGFINVFDVVPAWAQQVVTYSLPLLALTNAFMAVLNDAVSDTAGAERKAAKEIRTARNSARVDYAKGKAEQYRQRATGARAMGKTEGDAMYDDDKTKGFRPYAPRPAFQQTATALQNVTADSQTRPEPQNVSSTWYDMPAFLKALNLTEGQARAKWIGKDYSAFAGEVSQSLDISGKNMRKIYYSLFPTPGEGRK